MEVFLVFNELSASPIAPDSVSGKQRLDGFGELLLDQRIRGKKVLVTPPGFLQSQVSLGFSIGRWLKESKQEEPARTRLKLLFDRRKHYSELSEADAVRSDDAEYRCGYEIAQGLSLAFLVEGLAVSFWSAERWNVTALDLEKSWLGKESVETSALSVPHACQSAHLATHTQWLLERGREQPTTGSALWDARETLFPNLDFCDSAAAQIRDLWGTGPRFKAVLRGLRDLQRYCDDWTAPNFDIHQLVNASGESGPTLQMYSKQRTFRCPDGKDRVFEWHLKRGDNTRIHFLDLPSVKRVLVGYVGPHLPISGQ